MFCPTMPPSPTMAGSDDEANDGIMLTQAPAQTAQADAGPVLTQAPRPVTGPPHCGFCGFFLKPQAGCAMISACVIPCVLFEGGALHDGVPVPDSGLLLGRHPEQKQREVDPTINVEHGGEQVAAVLAHDPPSPPLLSRSHVLLKVSDDKASLVVENISTTQSVLVKRGGALHGGASGQRYKLMKPGDKEEVQWGTRLFLGYKTQELAEEPESEAYRHMTFDVMMTKDSKSGKGSKGSKSGKGSKIDKGGSGQRTAQSTIVTAKAAATNLTAAAANGDPAVLQAAIIKTMQQLGKAADKNTKALTHEDQKAMRKRSSSFRPNKKSGRGGRGNDGGGGPSGRGAGRGAGRGGGGGPSKKGASRSGAGGRRR